MQEKPTYYITTPIYYPSAKLHMGNAYTTVVADTMSRYKKLRGYDVKFLTGTDEHGLKIEQTAREQGLAPKEYLDGMCAWIKDLWKTLQIDYDIFIRTTDDYHEKAVQKIFKKLYDQGDIYKGTYEGMYCIPCESFFTESQLVDGKCPDCGRDVQVAKEESYFLKMSKYQDRLLKYIEDHPDFIKPESRKNEMINNFIKPGLEDLAVSRTSFKWGIPVDFDPDHVIYVWIDAVSNYISALGYYSDDEGNNEYKKFWPADVHLVGKEIIRFHTIIWPIILMALGEPLPKQVYGHGWLSSNGKKMSKSMGNGVDPIFLTEKYGVDAIRYFLMREITFGQDGDFNAHALLQRINSDLANDLGNLLSRTVAMIDKYFDGKLPSQQKPTEFDADLIKTAETVVSRYAENMDNLVFNEAFNEVWVLIKRANKYIDETAPWVMAKDESKKEELANVLYNLAEVLRISTILVSPCMPNTPNEIFRQLNISESDTYLRSWESIEKFGGFNKDVSITKGNVIFPRLDIKKELEENFSNDSEKTVENIKTSQKESKKETKKEPKKEITIDDFDKVELKVGVIVECEKVEGSDKLLKSQIKIDKETRQIVSGIASYYTPEQMVGKKVVVVTNLKPVKLRGVLSQGMILAATDENGNLNAVTVDGDIEDGSEVR